MPGSMLVHGGPLWAGPGRYWPQGAVAIDQGKVLWAGPADQCPPGPWNQKLDAQGGLIMPGLVNAHCHSPMVLFRGLADDLPLEDWLTQHMFPAEARWVTPDMTELCSQLAAAEMLLSGTTCVGDSYFCAAGAARGLHQAGLRAVAAQGVIDFPAPGVPDPQQKFSAVRDFVDQVRDLAPLVTPAIFCHSAYTCSPDTLVQAAELAADLNLNWYTHLAETQAEVKTIQLQHHATPAQHLENLGLLASLQAAVHCVWLEPPEIDLLIQRQVSLVHCPQSNMKLASGAAPAAAWLTAGAQIGLGTDGAASNNDLDMFGEMLSASLEAKLTTRDPSALSASQALAMATTGSAACLGLAGQVGCLQPDAWADLIILNTQSPHLTPLFHPESALVYQARGNDVQHVLVAGRHVVQNRQLTTLDLQQILAQVRSLADQVKKKL